MPPIADPSQVPKGHERYLSFEDSQSKSMGNDASLFAEDPSVQLDSWSHQILDYIEEHGDNFDPDDLVRRLQHVTRRLAKSLVDPHPIVVEEGFSFLTKLVTFLHEHLRPFMLNVISLMINDTTCPRNTCIQSLARLAAFDITCVAECFTTHMALDGRLRQMYYHVLRSIVDGATLVHMEVDAYDIFIHLLLDCLDNFRGPLRDRMTVLVEVALQSEKFPQLWTSVWDLNTKKRCKSALPESRRVAKFWAMETYETSSLYQKRVAQAQVPNGKPKLPPRRLFSQIGRKLNESEISSIHFDEPDHNPLDDTLPDSAVPELVETGHLSSQSSESCTTTPSPSPPKQSKQPKKSTPQKSSPPKQSPLPPVSCPEPQTQWDIWRQWFVSTWQRRDFMYILMACSIVYALSGLIHGTTAFLQDYEAWRIRVALVDLQTSIDRSEREVMRIKWRLQEMQQSSHQVDVLSTDKDQVDAITQAWKTIADDTAMQP